MIDPANVLNKDRDPNHRAPDAPPQQTDRLLTGEPKPSTVVRKSVKFEQMLLAASNSIVLDPPRMLATLPDGLPAVTGANKQRPPASAECAKTQVHYLNAVRVNGV